MSATELKKEISEQLNKADLKTLRAVRAMLREINNTKFEEDFWTADLITELDKRKANHVSGKSKSSTPQQVKAHALKQLRK